MTQVKFHPAPFRTLLNDLAFQTWNDVLAPALNNEVRPNVNIAETETGFKIELAAPGYEKGDFQIKVEKDLLTIRVQKEKEAVQEGVTWKKREFTAANFERSFKLPETVDSELLTAAYEAGILTLALPKKPEAQPVVKTIAVS